MTALLIGTVLFGSAAASAAWIADFSLLWILLSYWIGGNLGLLSTALIIATRRG